MSDKRFARVANDPRFKVNLSYFDRILVEFIARCCFIKLF